MGKTFGLDSIKEGDWLVLKDGTACYVEKPWHGRDNAWLVVAYVKNKTPIKRSVERSDIELVCPSKKREV